MKMKKMMMMFVVVLVAGMSQAASVNWGSGTLFVPNGDGTFSATLVGAGTAYSAIAYIYSDVGGTMLVTGLAGNTDSSTSVASILNGTATMTGGFLANTTYYTKIVVTSNDDKWQQTSTLAAFTIPGTGNITLNYLTGGGFATVSDKLPGQWTDLEPVPEPASMALFGLGAGVLALRRRFKSKKA